MKPTRLAVTGFTSFRDGVELDLSELDLFAITGPTGAGKSSLIDALTFALYGQVPRVGKEYRQLISHGAERFSVQLDFSVAGRSYRIARTAKATGAAQARLERIEATGATPLADRVREIEQQVETILGLDYDAFTRSVVLPQGQFDAFLKGKPEERRKILVWLLDLGLYEEMQRIANRRTADARREAAFIANQLAADYSEATPANLGAKQDELARAEQDRARLLERQKASAGAIAAAHDVRGWRRAQATLARDREAERTRCAEARRALEEIRKERSELERKRVALQRRERGLRFDQKRHLSLLEARPRVEQLEQLASTRERLTVAHAERVAAADSIRTETRQLETALAASAEGLALARGELERALAEREAARRRHAAHDLRRHLELGAACPVCEQTVTRRPAGGAPEIKSAEATVSRAERSLEQLQERSHAEKLRLERLADQGKNAETQLSGIETQREEARRSRADLERDLQEAGFGPLELADPSGLLARIAEELAVLEKGRRQRERLETEREKLAGFVSELEARAAAARAQDETANARLKELEERLAEAGTSLAEAQQVLRELAARVGWEDLKTRLPERDEAAELEERRGELQRQSAELSGSVERLRAELRSLEHDVARAAELTERRQRLEADAALAGALAQHLQANQFVGFVQEEALRRLAEDGSRHLEGLSQGRYSLSCEEQEFLVVDHWNADLRRSVKTLSGGETFLASLALALALAESLASLSPEGRAGDALESLFLDEGFGTLDPETLDVVVAAIESLHGGRRMVGIVTHIQELAERLPARVEVRRSAEGATLSVR